MRAWEEAAYHSGMTEFQLMENAGRGAAEWIQRQFSQARPVLICCGRGNNAGDGFVIARLLKKTHMPEVLFLGRSSGFKEAALLNFAALGDFGIPIKTELAGIDFQKYGVIVDALLGTGLKREIDGVFKETIHNINSAGKPVIAVDVPTGLNADTGEMLGIAVKATATLTFGAVKNGLLTGCGPLYSGEISVIDIGLPKSFLEMG